MPACFFIQRNVGIRRGLVKRKCLCYNGKKKVGSTGPIMKGRDMMILSAEFFWNLFKITGSISAYLVYKEFLNRVN